MDRFDLFVNALLLASAHLWPSHPKATMQSLHVLRYALHGRLLPLHSEQRQAARSASEQESVAMWSLYAYTIPHSLRSYGICSGSAAAHRYRFATHSFNGYRCCPIPPFAQTSFGKSFVSSLHSHVASKHRCFGNLTFLVHWLKARNYRCYDER